MAEKIKEFLVALGFQIDEAGWRKFNQGLAQSGKAAAELGSITATTATAIALAVEKVARQYETLYYVSQRTGSSVSTLRAYEFGVRQIGLTSDQARQSVEGFAASIRTNPGLAGLLRGMGVDPSDAKNAQSQFVKALHNRFGERGYFAAQQMAQLFGMDEITFRQMYTNIERLGAAEDEQKKRMAAAGINADDAAKKFTAFSRVLNRLEDDLAILGERIALDFLDPATKAIEAIDGIIQAVNRLDKETGGAVGVAGTLATSALGGWLLKRLIGRIFGTGAAAAATAGGAEAAGGATAAAGSGIGGILMRGLGPLGILLGSTTAAGESDAAERARREGGAGGPAAQTVAFFQKLGWSRENALGIAANLSRESGFSPRAVGDGGQGVGVAQWHPDRQAAFKRWAGKDIRNASFAEQLAFIHYELTEGGEQFAGRKLRQAGTAGESATAVSRYYERPKDSAGEEAKRALLAEKFGATLTPEGTGGGVNVTQKTDIHVAAGPTALDTAQHVLSAQDRVNGDLVRNTVGSAR